MAKQDNVDLTPDERQDLEHFTTTGNHAADQSKHARLLLKADRHQPDGSWRDTDIKSALDLSLRTIERVRQRFVEEGLEAALKCRPGAGRKREVTGEVEAPLLALRCSAAPTGVGRWTLRWLAARLVARPDVAHLSHASVRPVLKKPNCNPGSKSVG